MCNFEPLSLSSLTHSVQFFSVFQQFSAESGMDDNSTFRAGPLILKLKGILFDVTEFAESHPGGPDILWQSKDESIDEYFKGSKALGGLRHCHSKSALELLHKMRITPGSQEQQVEILLLIHVHSSEKCLLQKDPVDYSKPMLSQVGSLGDHYWAWLHQPISHDIRIFQSDVAEFFSRTYWWLVPTIWLPVAVCLLNKAITSTDSY